MSVPVRMRQRRGSRPSRHGDVKVALVNMPWVSAQAPSIQLGLLGAIARREGFEVDIVHANLDLAARVGLDRADRLGEARRELYGEWLFSVEAFGENAPDADDAVFDGRELPEGETPESLTELRATDIPAFLDDLMSERDWSAYSLVGFTSTFQQNVASLALARRLAELDNAPLVLFGGANLDDAMGEEVMASFPVVDYVIRGEADLAFPQLLSALAHDETPTGVPGLLRRVDGEIVGEPPEPVDDLDALPLPDYEEYFERAARLGIMTGGHPEIELPIETARGCWWGAKKHCTFCGLNGTTMAFRAKSPDRALGELLELSRRHDATSFAPVDNIMDRRYLAELFPQLELLDLDLDFFYEVKSDLSPDELTDLARWRVRRIQPGIESLNTRTLVLMDKGVRASTNVNLMRWCAQLGIEAGWNLLWGFPGERTDDVADQAALLANLHHLPPPGGGGRIWMERFSPLFRNGDFAWRRASSGYGFAYPDHVDLEQLAYFFDYELVDALPDEAYVELEAAIAAWRDRWEQSPLPSLTVVRGVDKLYVDDRRSLERAGSYTLEGVTARLYDSLMTSPVSTTELAARFPRLGDGELERTLDQFIGAGLVMRDGNLFLALALPAA